MLKKLGISKQVMLDIINQLNDNPYYKANRREWRDEVVYKPFAKKAWYTKQTDKNTNLVIPSIWLKNIKPELCSEIEVHCYIQVYLYNDNNYDETLEVNEIKKVPNAYRCMKRLQNVIYKHYSLDQVNNIINDLDVDNDADKQTLHISITQTTKAQDYNKVVKHENCYYYDLNSAYLDGLATLFPESRDDFEALYQMRKKQPELKDVFTHGIGKMKHYDDWTKVRSYIVRRTSEILTKAIEQTGGLDHLIYANTDGFVVKDPVTLLDNLGTKLGQFKDEEPENRTCYTYRRCDDNMTYSCFQIGNTKKCCGGIQKIDLKYIDLSQNIIVDYDARTYPLGFKRENGKEATFKIHENQKSKRI